MFRACLDHIKFNIIVLNIFKVNNNSRVYSANFDLNFLAKKFHYSKSVSILP